MKRTFVFVALLAVVFGVSAQSMKVQSAYSDMKNERLANAKQNIDEACQNEKTMNDPKTWNYAGLIYAQLVDASANNKKLWKKQKIDTPVEELCQTGIAAFKKSLELEQKEGTHEYTQSSMEALKVLCGYEFMYAGNVYNAGQYEQAVDMFKKVVDDARLAGHKDVEADAMYYQADCYRMLKQTDKEMEMYRALAKANTNKADVYLKIYADNKSKGDTVKAVNALKKGVKMTAKDKNVNTLMKTELASAYLWAGQNAEADNIINAMLENADGDVAALNGIARIYGEQGVMDKAEEYYNKSLALKSDQIEALKGMGNAYFAKALKEHKVADAIPYEQVDAYNKKMGEAYALYEKSIPYFENTLKVKADDYDSLNKLRVIYSVFGGKTDVDAATKKAYAEKAAYYSQEVKKLSR